MKKMSAYHRSLFFGKITDTLNAAEQKELDNLLATNDEAKIYFEELLTTLPAEDVNDGYAFLNQPGFWKDIPAKKVVSKTSLSFIKIVRKIAVAALVAGIIIGGWLVLSNKNSHPDAPAFTKQTQSIELQLANGEKINLSNQKGDVVVGNVKLQNADDNLRYEATGGMAGLNTVLVPVGMDYRITLSDGSVVWMNSATRLDFPFNFDTEKREISIDGEAYLQIIKDKKKPFIVHLPGSNVEVLGTEFNVNSYRKDMVSVSLVEGGVMMSAHNKKTTLSPGMEGVLSNNLLTQQTFEARTTLGWRKGLYYFEEATLNDILPVLNRWFGINSIVDRPELKTKQFAGVLDKNKPVEVFLQNLKRISKIDTYFDAEHQLHFK